MENWIGNSISTSITIVISCLTLLSYYLSINEYYSNKAYWAYYHVNIKYRKEMRSGFQAIYLSVALIIIVTFGIISYVISSFWSEIEENWIMWCLCLCTIVSIIFYIVLKVMIWKIHLVDYNERRAWENKEKHSQFVEIKTKLLFFEYGVGAQLMLLGWFVCMKTQIEVLVIFFLLCTLIYMQFQGYSKELRLLDYRKWMDIVELKSRKYALIEVGSDWIYLIECEENEDKKELKLLLDNYVVLKHDCVRIKTRYYDKITRICNNNSCNERYIMKRRKS